MYHGNINITDVTKTIMHIKYLKKYKRLIIIQTFCHPIYTDYWVRPFGR